MIGTSKHIRDQPPGERKHTNWDMSRNWSMFLSFYTEKLLISCLFTSKQGKNLSLIVKIVDFAAVFPRVLTTMLRKFPGFGLKVG